MELFKPIWLWTIQGLWHAVQRDYPFLTNLEEISFIPILKPKKALVMLINISIWVFISSWALSRRSILTIKLEMPLNKLMPPLLRPNTFSLIESKLEVLLQVQSSETLYQMWINKPPHCKMLVQKFESLQGMWEVPWFWPMQLWTCRLGKIRKDKDGSGKSKKQKEKEKEKKQAHLVGESWNSLGNELDYKFATLTIDTEFA